MSSPPPNHTPPADDPVVARPSWRTLGHVGPALVTLVLCVAATYLIPGLGFARPWVPGDPVPFWNLLGRPFEQPPEHTTRPDVDRLADEVLATDEPPVTTPVSRPPRPPGARYEPDPRDLKPAPQPLELFAGDEIDPFFAALARTDTGEDGAVTRVVHWGDSSIGMDGIPGAIRRRMQARFGDAGHGFHLMAPPNTSYRHREVRFRHNDGWGACFIIQKCRADGHYGLGGTTFRSVGGAESWFAPDPERSSGKVSRFKVWYAGQPRGGRLRLRVDRGEPIVVETAADALIDRWHTIEVPDGFHELSVRAAGGGRVRVYGVTLERDGPGVSWDGLALVGAFTNRMLEFDAEHLKAQLGERAPQLAVLTFGGNDMIRKISMERYEEEYRAVLRHVRAARPEMACLVMAPLDHGLRDGRRIRSLPVVPKMVQAQRRAAQAEGCAFFDTYQAMGGEGGAARWFRKKPRLLSGDLAHATAAGQKVLGELVFRAITQAYVAYRRAHPDSPREPRERAGPGSPP